MTNTIGFDCIIAGSGFCGSVIARKLAEYNKKVLIVERRNHIAGNMYDEIDSNGILVQRYGPHIFHTNKKEVYDFITKYGKWIDYHHRCGVVINGIVTPSPANLNTIDLLYNSDDAKILKKKMHERYSDQKKVNILEFLNCDDLAIKQYANKLYSMNYLPYTIKQWGITPEKMDPNILKRVPVRLDYTDGYFDDTYQCLPENGYSWFFNNLLDHKNIEVMLNTNIFDLIKIDEKKTKILFKGKSIPFPVIYTGTIDELLGYRYGKLPYRSLLFKYQTINTESFQKVPVVAHPAAKGYTRITEYKKIPPQNIPKTTTVAYEYPLPADKDNEPYYPILTDENVLLYNKYLLCLDGISNLFLCGRLGDYKYYNMDTVIMRAFEIFNSVK